MAYFSSNTDFFRLFTHSDVLEGGPVEVSEIRIPELSAAKIKEGAELRFEAKNDAELLLVEVLLA